MAANASVQGHGARADFAQLIDQLLGGFDSRFDGMRATALRRKLAPPEPPSVEVNEVSTDTSELAAGFSEGTSDTCECTATSTASSDTGTTCDGCCAAVQACPQPQPQTDSGDDIASPAAAAASARCTPEAQVRLALFKRRRRQAAEGTSVSTPVRAAADELVRAAQQEREEAVQEVARLKAALEAATARAAAAAEEPAAEVLRQEIGALTTKVEEGRCAREQLGAELGDVRAELRAVAEERDMAMRQFDEILPQLLAAEEDNAAMKKHRDTLEERLRCHERATATRQRREMVQANELERLRRELKMCKERMAAAAATGAENARYVCRGCRGDVDDVSIALGRAEEEILGLMQHNVSLIEQLEQYVGPEQEGGGVCGGDDRVRDSGGVERVTDAVGDGNDEHDDCEDEVPALVATTPALRGVTIDPDL